VVRILPGGQNFYPGPNSVGCKFCAFKKKDGDEESYRMSLREILDKAEEEYHRDLKEFHIVGGLDKKYDLEFYEILFSALQELYPSVHIKALTAVEIAYLAQEAGLSFRETLTRLRKAGLGSLPGGGAEIFNEALRKKICPEKITADEWLEVMDTAHSLGLKSNATLLYGHLETIEHRVEHLVRLREQQDKSGGCLAFIPLAFHPKNTDYSYYQTTPANLDLKMIAISRLMLDNFPHIKAFWIMITLPIAQLAQNFGADDIDGTILDEKITHSAGGETPYSVTKSQLCSMIKETGYYPVERDTLYNPVAS